MPLSDKGDKITNENKLSIYGYPAQKFTPTNKQKTNYQASQFGSTESGRLIDKNIEKGEILHQISTLPGMSGTSIVM